MKYYVRTNKEGFVTMLLKSPHPLYKDCVAIELIEEEHNEIVKSLSRYKLVSEGERMKLQYVAPTEQKILTLEQEKRDWKIRAIRHQRERECFPVINRGYMWYMQLSETQLGELNAWYQAWLDVTETQMIPQKPEWIR